MSLRDSSTSGWGRLARSWFVGVFVSGWIGGAWGAIIRVPGDQPTIQAGIDATAEGDTVLVAPGIYIGTGNKRLDFGGIDKVVMSTAGAESTVIDCEGGGVGFYFLKGETKNSVIEGFRIINASNSAVRCVDASPTILRCILADNEAVSYGAGVYCETASPTLSNCVLVNNATAYGGGVYCHDSAYPVLTNVIVVDNSVTHQGGAVFIDDLLSIPKMTNCIVWGNTPNQFASDGGAFLVRFSDVDGGWPGAGNLDEEPGFADPDSGDYHLVDSSLCKDAGDPTVLDACRPPGLGTDRSDMGAYGGEENCGWDTCDTPMLLRLIEPDTIYLGDTAAGSWSIQACPDSAATFAVAPSCDWLVFTPDQGVAPADTSIEVILDYDAAGLPPGDSDCDVTITWDDTLDINELVSITVISPIDLERSGEPEFLYPDEFAEAEWQITNLSAQNDLVVDITEPCSWLELSPSALIVPPSSTLSTTAFFDATDLIPGIYDCDVTLVYADSFEVIAPVSLNVLSPLGDIVRVVEPDSIYLGDVAEGQWEIWNLSAQVPLTVDFEPGCAWLDLAPNPLVIPEDTSAVVTLIYHTGGLVPGDYECPVTLTYADSLEIELPVTLTTVSPFTVTITDHPTSVRGGNRLRWRFAISNDTDDYRDAEVWFDGFLINGSPYPKNPVDGPHGGLLGPFFVAEYPNSILIPPGAPVGGPYRLCTRAGVWPDFVWSEDCFEFSVAP